MKTRLLLLFSALMMTISGSAQFVIEKSEISSEGVNIVVNNTANNYQYVISNYDDNGTQRLQLALQPIDAEQPAAVVAQDKLDQNYWEPLFRRLTGEYLGTRLTAQDNLTKLIINSVAVPANLFYDYEALTDLYIAGTGDYTIQEGCFSECYGLQLLNENVLGTLTVTAGSVPDNVCFEVQSALHTDTWQAYKESNSAYLYAPVTTPVIAGATLTVNGTTLTYTDTTTPTVAERTLGDAQTLVIGEHSITMKTPGGRMPDAARLYFKVYKAGGSAEQEGFIDYASTKNTADGRMYVGTSTEDILSALQLEDGKDYVLEYYWQAAQGEETVFYGQDNNKFRVYFTYKGTLPAITGCTVTLDEDNTISLTAEEFDPLYIADPVESLVLKSYTATTEGNTDDVTLVYTIDDGEQQEAVATKQDDDSWLATVDLDIAKDITDGQQHKLMLAVKATNSYGTAWFDNDGLWYRIYFSTVASTGINNITAAQDTSGVWYTLDGRSMDRIPETKGIYIHNGRKVIIK